MLETNVLCLRWMQLMEPHIAPEIDRLMLEINLNPSLSRGITGRPSYGLERDPNQEVLAYLSIPCVDLPTAFLLSSLEEWEALFLPFRGDLYSMRFTYPGGQVFVKPEDPHCRVIAAAYRQILTVDVEVEIVYQPWVSTCEFLGFSKPIPSYPEYPSLTLLVRTLKGLDNVYQRWEILHRLALATVPDLKRFDCLLIPSVLNPVRVPDDCVLCSWQLQGERWVFDETALNNGALATLLLIEAGLTPQQLQELIAAGLSHRALSAHGSHTGMKAVAALIPEIKTQLRLLRHIPALNRIKDLILCPPGEHQTLSLQEEVTPCKF